MKKATHVANKNWRWNCSENERKVDRPQSQFYFVLTAKLDWLAESVNGRFRRKSPSSPLPPSTCQATTHWRKSGKSENLNHLLGKSSLQTFSMLMMKLRFTNLCNSVWKLIFWCVCKLWFFQASFLILFDSNVSWIGNFTLSTAWSFRIVKVCPNYTCFSIPASKLRELVHLSSVTINIVLGYLG